MQVAVDDNKCLGCSLCVLECPEEAITARSIAVIDEDKCTDCMECLDSCPVDAMEEAGS